MSGYYPPDTRVYYGRTPCIVAAVGTKDGDRWHMLLDKHRTVTLVPDADMAEALIRPRVKWAPVDKAMRTALAISTPAFQTTEEPTMTTNKPKRGPGRPPKAAKAVEALEAAGMPDAARVAAQAAGLPTRPLTPVEDFLLGVRELVGRSETMPVGFNLDSAEQASEWAALVGTLPAPRPGLRYHVAQQRGPNGEGSRLEVSVRG